MSVWQPYFVIQKYYKVFAHQTIETDNQFHLRGGGKLFLILITSTTHAKACEQKPALITSMAHEKNCILKYLNLVKCGSRKMFSN